MPPRRLSHSSSPHGCTRPIPPKRPIQTSRHFPWAKWPERGGPPVRGVISPPALFDGEHVVVRPPFQARERSEEGLTQIAQPVVHPLGHNFFDAPHHQAIANKIMQCGR